MDTISQESIEQKLGFTIKEYLGNEKTKGNVISHEKDNVPNPFDVLSLEELLFFERTWIFSVMFICFNIVPIIKSYEF